MSRENLIDTCVDIVKQGVSRITGDNAVSLVRARFRVKSTTYILTLEQVNNHGNGSASGSDIPDGFGYKKEG